MANQHVADRVLEQRIVRRQDGAAGVSEDVGDAFANEAFPENLCAGAFHSCGPQLSTTEVTEDTEVKICVRRAFPPPCPPCPRGWSCTASSSHRAGRRRRHQ